MPDGEKRFILDANTEAMTGLALVTGCSGFIGSHLVASLLQQGVSLKGLSRHPDRCPAGNGCDYIEGDLRRPGTLAGIAEGVHTVYHLAGYAHATDPSSAIHHELTVEGTRRLLAEARRWGVSRFVYVSSVKAMPGHPVDCVDETWKSRPDDDYGRTRRLAEDLVFRTGKSCGMHVSVLRPALVYGAGCKGNLASMMKWISRGLFPPIPATNNIRSMVDVRDLVRAIITAAEAPAANGRDYIITDGQDYTTRQIYTAMCISLDRKVPRWVVPSPILRLAGRAGDTAERLLGRPLAYNSAVCSRLLDSACYRSIRATRDLGFEPLYLLQDALPGMVRQFRIQSDKGA